MKVDNTANMSSNGKKSHDIQSAVVGINNDGHFDEKNGTDADRADMYRMGKTQEMKVRTNSVALDPCGDMLIRNDRGISDFCPSLAFP
jgi:hypothetical protein